ncbi:class I SAM-dependent methyltransferase [Bacillaceae bacterium SIJ1]|uniref:class I SAM-dependent methyltransferase n=1 Tax=Litoribacterium kuwaitense TaxID=1398745 RepID=UPI0013EDC77D|nr:class I SAM-dependent methyltransferase [Litoribacterium kuwaitense]NGP44174.1 class I SAM-dependent methyltransferase [Litoribacterium kuwaitense]
MHSTTDVETMFNWLDQEALQLEKKRELSYLEGLALAAERAFHEPSQTLIDLERTEPESIRRALQLGILKGMKSGVQPHHAMTPDGVSLLIAMLCNLWLGEQKEWQLFDPAVGTSNLLTAVMNQAIHKPVQASGVDADETLLQLSVASANLQRHEIAFSHQDALKPMYVNQADVLICDLPVGYYPGDAAAYQLKDASGERLPYAHHLFIEQSLRYTKANGHLFLVVPNTLFETDKDTKLREFIHQEAIIHSFFNSRTIYFYRKNLVKVS